MVSVPQTVPPITAGRSRIVIAADPVPFAALLQLPAGVAILGGETLGRELAAVEAVAERHHAARHRSASMHLARRASVVRVS